MRMEVPLAVSTVAWAGKQELELLVPQDQLPVP